MRKRYITNERIDEVARKLQAEARTRPRRDIAVGLRGRIQLVLIGHRSERSWQMQAVKQLLAEGYRHRDN